MEMYTSAFQMGVQKTRAVSWSVRTISESFLGRQERDACLPVAVELYTRLSSVCHLKLYSKIFKPVVPAAKHTSD